MFISRIKSFGWRFLAYIVAVALAWIADNFKLLELDPFITTIVGLVLGELSKAWAAYQKKLGKSFFGRAL